VALPGAAFFLLGTDFFAPVVALAALAAGFFATAFFAAVTFFLPVDLLGAGAFFVAAFFVVRPDAGFAFDFTVSSASIFELRTVINDSPGVGVRVGALESAGRAVLKADPFWASAL